MSSLRGFVTLETAAAIAIGIPALLCAVAAYELTDLRHRIDGEAESIAREIDHGVEEYRVRGALGGVISAFDQRAARNVLEARATQIAERALEPLSRNGHELRWEVQISDQLLGQMGSGSTALPAILVPEVQQRTRVTVELYPGGVLGELLAALGMYHAVEGGAYYGDR